MKTKLIFLFLILSVNSLLAVEYYIRGDTLYNWANGGLNIREIDKLDGPKIGIIPYGESLIVLESKYTSRYDNVKVPFIKKDKNETAHEIGSIKSLKYDLKDRWVKIKYGEIEGFVFDGYISLRIAPKGINSSENQSRKQNLFDYITNNFEKIGVDSKSERKGDYGINNQFFVNGISILNKYEKSAYFRYTIPNFSIEEVLILLVNSRPEKEFFALTKIENQMKDSRVQVLEFAFSYTGTIRITYIDNVIIVQASQTC